MAAAPVSADHLLAWQIDANASLPSFSISISRSLSHQHLAEVIISIASKVNIPLISCSLLSTTQLS